MKHFLQFRGSTVTFILPPPLRGFQGPQASRETQGSPDHGGHLARRENQACQEIQGSQEVEGCRAKLDPPDQRAPQEYL